MTSEKHVAMNYPRDHAEPIQALITGEQVSFNSFGDIADYAEESGFAIGTARGLVNALSRLHMSVAVSIDDCEMNGAISGIIEALEAKLRDIDTDRHVIVMAARHLQGRSRAAEHRQEAERIKAEAEGRRGRNEAGTATAERAQENDDAGAERLVPRGKPDDSQEKPDDETAS